MRQKISNRTSTHRTWRKQLVTQPGSLCLFEFWSFTNLMATDLLKEYYFKKTQPFSLLQTGRKDLQKNFRKNKGAVTHVAKSSWALAPFPGRAHQAMPFTRAGCARECRRLQQPPRHPQSFTVSSLAQVRRILPIGSHFILTTISCWIAKNEKLLWSNTVMRRKWSSQS